MSKGKNIHNLTNQGLIMPLIYNDSLLDQQLNFPNSSIPLIQPSSSTTFVSGFNHEQAETMPMSESLGEGYSSPYSPADLPEKNKKRVGYKRKRNKGRFEEKPEEVIHVRAKRGHATDSHSLAERVRREKINEKLRCLQDLVPGCYKAMGMAVMLDVIINYVLSLQQQIEFLSMKLSAASMYFDFNTWEMDATGTMQRSTGTDEIQGTERMAGEGYGGFPYFDPPLH